MSLEHGGTTLGYDDVTFDLTVKGRVKGEATTPKGRTVIIRDCNLTG